MVIRQVNRQNPQQEVDSSIYSLPHILPLIPPHLFAVGTLVVLHDGVIDGCRVRLLSKTV